MDKIIVDEIQNDAIKQAGKEIAAMGAEIAGNKDAMLALVLEEIGRASCRERV